MGIRICCEHNDGVACKNEKVPRSLMGLGARMCCEVDGKSCPHKKPTLPPLPPRGGSAAAAPASSLPRVCLDGCSLEGTRGARLRLWCDVLSSQARGSSLGEALQLADEAVRQLDERLRA